VQRGRHEQLSLPGLVMLRIGMKRTAPRRAAAMAACAFAACIAAWSPAAHAQSGASSDLSRVLELIDQQEHRLNAQQRQLNEQQRQLEEQRALIERQRAEILAMSGGVSDSELGGMRAAGVASSALNDEGLASDAPIALNRRTAPLYTLAQTEGGSAPAASAAAPPTGPVGEAPREETQPSAVAALPEGQTALLGRGRLVLEPAFEYSRSSGNRLVFRGVEIVSGIQIGLIEANNTARDTLSGSITARYALTDRLEIEGRVPYIYRSDRVTTVSQNNQQTTQTFELQGGDIGDIEFSARYQLNKPQPGRPIFVAGARVKTDTGKGPFELARDAHGVSTELATGSGFWGVQGSLSMLYPSDPVVLYANASYLWNIERDIDRTVGQVTIGNVDPGDSIGFGFGFGFSVNPRFSYSLGYSHSYVMETETELNNTTQTSTELQVGALALGMSFRATEQLTVSTGVNVGVTEDAPDVSVSLRLPFRW
jgi:hypothetical protein